MAANLRPYQPKGRRNTTKIERPITRGEAGEILLSALTYCQKASMSVRLFSDNGALYIVVSGLEYDGERVTPSAPKVTPMDTTPAPHGVTTAQ